MMPIKTRCMTKRWLMISLLVLTAFSASSQRVSPSMVMDDSQCKQMHHQDSTSIWHALQHGDWNGHVRYFFMATENEGELTNYVANALGAGLRFETAPFHHFQLAVHWNAVKNVGSSELSKPDRITGQISRYELALFDITHPGNTDYLTRIDEAYLRYKRKSYGITLGRQYINTPFINQQDGRMNSTAVSGLWSHLHINSKTGIDLGWFWGISPRSTDSWHQPGESIGINPVGVNPDGNRSGYAHQVKSNGLGIVQFNAQPFKQLQVHLSNLLAENLLNVVFLQMDYTQQLDHSAGLLGSFQFIGETGINNGGQTDPEKSYYPKGNNALCMGARIGMKKKIWEITLNYTRMASTGRYLMPREWGREPFFTYLTRERNEGFGGVDAIMLKVNCTLPKPKLFVSWAMGYYHLPDVLNFTLNKYGLPSYAQINTDLRYTFKVPKGLDLELLMVGKLNEGATYNDDKYVFNKVNVFQFNCIINYHF